jgi:hypothetical protein
MSTLIDERGRLPSVAVFGASLVVVAGVVVVSVVVGASLVDLPDQTKRMNEEAASASTLSRYYLL